MCTRGLKEISRVLRRTESSWKCMFSTQSDILVAAGVPPIREGRKVTIFAPGKTPMQSGSAQTLEGGF